jgi:hypothetical protein
LIADRASARRGGDGDLGLPFHAGGTLSDLLAQLPEVRLALL